MDDGLIAMAADSSRQSREQWLAKLPSRAEATRLLHIGPRHDRLFKQGKCRVCQVPIFGHAEVEKDLCNDDHCGIEGKKKHPCKFPRLRNLNVDLFGDPIPPPETGARSDAELRRERRRAYEIPKGHAWTPGSGPAGETCGTCRHRRFFKQSRAWYKCAKNESAWSHARHTDIRLRDAACKFWQAEES